MNNKDTERLKKTTVAFLKEFADKGYENAVECIAWLEKQDKKDKVNCPQNHQDVNHQNGCIVYEDFRGGEGFYKVNLDYLNKKQVEKIEELTNTWNKDSRASDENIKNCIGMCLTDVSEQRFKDYNTTLRDCLAWLEKIGEQNPAENAEPKFNVSDIITNGKIVGKVDENENNKYHGWFGYDKDLSVHYADIPDVENWHLWTMQDAKDGDVLAYDNNNIVMFKDLYNHTSFHSYCYIEDSIFTISKEDCPDWWEAEGFYPATREQRDILFKAMSDAGYTFDFEKKKLSKCERRINMTQEDKELLLKDLSARLPYGVFCNIGLNYPLQLQRIFVDRLDGILLDFYEDGDDYQVYLSEVKPYLRSLSSMTDNEKKEYKYIASGIEVENGVCIPNVNQIDWLNVNYFDYRGLLEKGLAFKVTAENNPYK